jgi:hypothetical protein
MFLQIKEPQRTVSKPSEARGEAGTRFFFMALNTFTWDF